MMKYIFTISFILLFTAIQAQRLTAKQVMNSTSRPKGPFTEYVTKSGNVFHVGDTLFLGTPVSGNAYQYIEVHPEGEGMIRRLRPTIGLKSFQILVLRVDFSARLGYYLQVESTGPTPGSRCRINLEGALQNKELVSDQNSEENAFAALRKAKEKLDLQLITQAQYDSLKRELSKDIK